MNAFTRMDLAAGRARNTIAEANDALRETTDTAERVAIMARRAAAIRVLRVRVRA